MVSHTRLSAALIADGYNNSCPDPDQRRERTRRLSNNPNLVPSEAMKRLPDTIEMLKPTRRCPAAESGVSVIEAFSSLIRNEQHPGGDIDVPTEMERAPRISLVGLVELQNHSPGVFGIRVAFTPEGT